MGQHGGTSIAFQNKIALHDPIVSVSTTDQPKGFRHYKLRARDKPLVSNRNAGAERAAKLELRMTAALNWDDAPKDLPGGDDFVTQPHPDPHDNPYVPSAYTYFCQFVAHDMVSTRVPFWATENLADETANDRMSRLRLDSLYGAGPGEMPIIFAPADPNDLSRCKLQLGRSGPVPIPGGQTVCPYRDIARLKLSNTLGDLPGLTEALVADQRNDDHALISQLTMLFCHLHNIFIDRQKSVSADDPSFSFTHDAVKLFANARSATTLVYRHLIREDLLKRLLHPSIYQLYTTGTPPFFDLDAGSDQSALPLEFSHAAFRFGHAMVREAYRINAGTPAMGRPLQDALERFSSARNIHMQPMPETWLIQWSNFCNIPNITDPARINLSRRIGPRAPLSLFGSAFGAIDGSVGRGIFYRDLISAELANLWGVNDLLDAMQDHPKLGPVIMESAFLRDRTWRNEIADWLPSGAFPPGTPDPWTSVLPETKQADIDAIAKNPPLPFFILFEAWKEPETRGCRLGRFGSALVAETLFVELNNTLASEGQSDTLAERLTTLHPKFADKAFEGSVTLASVIGFIDRCLQASSDPAMKFPSLL